MNKQKPSQKTSYTFSKVPNGSNSTLRKLALIKTISTKPGPTVWLTGAIHGDEIGGIVVIQKIFKRLKREPLLKGVLCAFPLMNPDGFEIHSRTIPLSDEDLNRAFPGNKNGTLAERIAHKIFSTISSSIPDLVLDLHNDWTNSIPYTLLDPPEIFEKAGSEKAFGESKKVALRTPFPVVQEYIDAYQKEPLDRSLTTSLVLSGIPAITLELGESYRVNEKNVEDGVTAIWRILADLGMVVPTSSATNYKIPEELQGKVLTYWDEPTLSLTGIVRFLVKPGDLINKGQPIVKVYDVFGKPQETLLSEAESIVLGHSDYSVAVPGLSIMAFGNRQ